MNENSNLITSVYAGFFYFLNHRSLKFKLINLRILEFGSYLPKICQNNMAINGLETMFENIIQPIDICVQINKNIFLFDC